MMPYFEHKPGEGGKTSGMEYGSGLAGMSEEERNAATATTPFNPVQWFKNTNQNVAKQLYNRANLTSSKFSSANGGAAVSLSLENNNTPTKNTSNYLRQQ